MVKHTIEALANLDELEHEIQGIKEVIQHGGRPSYVIDHLRQMQKYLKNAEYHMGHLEKQQKAAKDAVDPFEAFVNSCPPNTEIIQAQKIDGVWSAKTISSKTAKEETPWIG